MRYCQALTKNGIRCQAPPITGTSLCFWHTDPERAKQASSKGGLGNGKKLYEVHARIKDPYDLALFLEEAVGKVAEALGALEQGDK